MHGELLPSLYAHKDGPNACDRFALAYFHEPKFNANRDGLPDFKNGSGADESCALWYTPYEHICEELLGGNHGEKDDGRGQDGSVRGGGRGRDYIP